MTWAVPSSAHITISKIALAGALIAIPAAAVTIPAYATPDGAATVLPAPPPADPPTNEPAPPAQPTHGEYYNPNDQDDWWVYSGTGSF